MSELTNEDAVIDLPTAVNALLTQARDSQAGRAARTLTPGAGAPLKQTLLALTEGTVLADHDNPGEATIQVLAGRVRLTSGDAAVELAAGSHAPIPPARHGVQALEDAVALVTVATRES